MILYFLIGLFLGFVLITIKILSQMTTMTYSIFGLFLILICNLNNLYYPIPVGIITSIILGLIFFLYNDDDSDEEKPKKRKKSK